MTIPLSTGAILCCVAFVCEYIDSTLGMGYGTALTPILLLMGFDPMVVVPSILLSEFATGCTSAFIHQAAGNVRFLPKDFSWKLLYADSRRFGLYTALNTTLPRALKVAIIIGGSSLVATVAAVFFAISLPSYFVKLYIGIMILTVGIVIVIRGKRHKPFSWLKITMLGAVASFNKGVSGGGYGPIVTGGQLLTGIDGKSAIAITSLAEGLTCCVGFSVYAASQGFSHLTLAPYLLAGALLSVPLSVLSVKRLRIKTLTYIIGGTTILLGAVTLIKLHFI